MKKFHSTCLLFLCGAVMGCSKTPLHPDEGEKSGAHMKSVLHPFVTVYSVVDPNGKETTATTFVPVTEIIGNNLERVEITLRRAGRSDSQATEKNRFSICFDIPTGTPVLSRFGTLPGVWKLLEPSNTRMEQRESLQSHHTRLDSWIIPVSHGIFRVGGKASFQKYALTILGFGTGLPPREIRLSPRR